MMCVCDLISCHVFVFWSLVVYIYIFIFSHSFLTLTASLRHYIFSPYTIIIHRFGPGPYRVEFRIDYPHAANNDYRTTDPNEW